MSLLLSALLLFAGVGLGLFFAALGFAARRADDSVELAMATLMLTRRRLDQNYRSWQEGYACGWDDRTEGRTMHPLIGKPLFLISEDDA